MWSARSHAVAVVDADCDPVEPFYATTLARLAIPPTAPAGQLGLVIRQRGVRGLEGAAVADLVDYADVGARDRAAMVGAKLLLAEGTVERETERAEVPITHLICRRLLDRSDLLGGLMRPGAGADASWGDTALLRGDEVRRPEPGSAQPKRKMPGSRDSR